MTRRWPRASSCVWRRAEECEVVYLTGRPERCRRDTLAWLAAQGLPEGRVHMRRNDDRRPARTTKLEILRRLGRDREIRMLVDDDELVCDDAGAGRLPGRTGRMGGRYDRGDEGRAGAGGPHLIRRRTGRRGPAVSPRPRAGSRP